MRFNENRCARCVEICPAGAIAIDDDIIVNERLCTGCMLCVSACPTDALDASGQDFFSVLGRLRKVPAPVLGCSAKPDIAAHVKTRCAGFLSEEHLIALAVFLPVPVQLNLTGCAGCGDSGIVESLNKRWNAVSGKIPRLLSAAIRLVEDAADLDYHDITYDRRGFFTALKNLTFLHASGVLDKSSTDTAATAYSAKMVSVKRELLNRALSCAPGEVRSGIVRHYYHTVDVNERCDGCFACVGMCPSGALKAGEKESAPVLLFNASLCSGCGLCRDFCMNNAVSIERGSDGHNLFDFALAGKRRPEDGPVFISNEQN